MAGQFGDGPRATIGSWTRPETRRAPTAPVDGFCFAIYTGPLVPWGGADCVGHCCHGGLAAFVIRSLGRPQSHQKLRITVPRGQKVAELYRQYPADATSRRMEAPRRAKPVQTSVLRRSTSLVAFLGPVSQACTHPARRDNHPEAENPRNPHDGGTNHGTHHRPDT